MKRLITTILLLALLPMTTVLAQEGQKLDKKEKKYWKKEARKYRKNPVALMELMDLYETMEMDYGIIAYERDSLQEELNAQSSQLRDMGRRIVSSEKQVKDQKALIGQLRETPKIIKAPRPDLNGTTYRVQIGAYAKRDMSKYFDKTESFQGEKKDGLQKYTLGLFKEKPAVDAFCKQLIALGIKDAWVVKYQDGVRIHNKTNGLVD